MISEDVVSALSTGLGLTAGTNLYIGVLPPQPDRCVAVLETGGFRPVHTMGTGPGNAIVENTRVQIMVRDRYQEGARQLAQNVWNALDGLNDQTINSTKIHLISALASPAIFGSQESGLTTFVANFDVVKAVSTSTST